MKKVCVVIITIIALISCKEQNANGPMILSGKIANPKTDSVVILDQANSIIQTIKLNKSDNTFADTFRIDKGFYNLLHGPERTSIFLAPGFDLNMELDTKSFDESLIYKGKGANENNYLAREFLFEESADMRKLNTASYLFSLDEKNYLKLADSVNNLRVTRLKNSGVGFDKDFEFWQLNNYELRKLYLLSSYELSYQFFSQNKDFKVSDQFPDPFKSLDINDEKLLMSPYYLGLIESYIFQKATASVKNNSSADRNLEVMNIVGNELKNQKVRENMARQLSRTMLDNTKELDKVYEKLTGFISDKKLLGDLKVMYEKHKKIEKGNLSPDFSFFDINNQPVTLASLKGKLVYLDIWATWCTPCLVEMPALKQLEADLNNYNIQFISIGMNDNRERWQKMIKEKELGGIHIYARDDSTTFFDDFLVGGIPRYILLDKNGNIIDPSAKRPTDPKLKEELLSLLQN
jgi:thiol-disulfide isomerase/thioredoxin